MSICLSVIMNIIIVFNLFECGCAVPKKFESSLSCVNFNFSVSLDNTKIAQIIIMVEEWHHPVKQVAQHFGITSARVYQLRAHYRKYGEITLLKKRGRKSRIISEQLCQDIIGLKLDLNLGSAEIATYSSFFFMFSRLVRTLDNSI